MAGITLRKHLARAGSIKSSIAASFKLWVSGALSPIFGFPVFASGSFAASKMSPPKPLSSHNVVYVGDVAYYLRDRVEWTFPSEIVAGGGIIPAVVFNADTAVLSADGLQDIFEGFQRSDDVFQAGFTQGGALIAQESNELAEVSRQLPQEVMDYVSLNSSHLLHISPTNAEKLPQGPYFLRSRHLHQAWRLYPDESRSFTVSVVPADNGHEHSFQPLHAGAYTGLYPVVAVPSRLYQEPTESKPLGGLRVSVKDLFHLAGIHTTAGSRSYTKLYGPQNETCGVVKRLVDLGATVVGKTQLGAYAGSEVPPEKCIDYFPPWNPRGDGYQGPSGSSSGAGSSVASYKWLDLSLGTDTTGSIRMPAASYGLWGLRGTINTFPLDGIIPSVKEFDTLGLLARSPEPLLRMIDGFVTDKKDSWPGVTQLLYPTDWFPMGDASQQRMVELFAEALARELQLDIVHTSLESRWADTAPDELRGTTLKEYLAKSVFWPNYFDGFHTWDKFRQDFQSKYDEPPYASPFMTSRWDLCGDISKEQRDQGIHELRVYGKWVDEQVINAQDKSAIMLVPLGRPGANYRDTLPAPAPNSKGPFQGVGSAYDAMSFSTALGLPQLVIPIGQNPYQSRVTQKTAYAPIVASLVGPKGSDAMLLRIATAALMRAGWPVEVQTGRNGFPVGKNERHVGESVVPNL